jgi:uncharacterized phage protein (TIGR01671 family)
MEQIKYRAWIKSIRTMVDVTSIDFDNRYISYYIGEWLRASSFSDIVLMQLILIADKNGIVIYEGDILAKDIRSEEDNIYVCEFDNTDARFVFCSPLDGEWLQENSSASDLIVIGNIYKNPELLNK